MDAVRRDSVNQLAERIRRSERRGVWLLYGAITLSAVVLGMVMVAWILSIHEPPCTIHVTPSGVQWGTEYEPPNPATGGDHWPPPCDLKYGPTKLGGR